MALTIPRKPIRPRLWRLPNRHRHLYYRLFGPHTLHFRLPLHTNYHAEQRDFYQLLSEYSDFIVREDVPDTSDKRIVLLGKPTKTADMQLKQIITSRKARNSDRLYIYEKVTEQQSGEENGSDNGSDEANQ